AGASLFAPVKERILSGQSTGEIRAWKPEGAFVLRPPVKLVLSDHRPPELYDLSRDPMEQRNLWDSSSARAANVPWLRAYFRASRGGLDLCRRRGQNCPAEFYQGT